MFGSTCKFEHRCSVCDYRTHSGFSHQSPHQSPITIVIPIRWLQTTCIGFSAASSKQVAQSHTPVKFTTLFKYSTHHNIKDNPNNTTRPFIGTFLIIGTSPIIATNPRNAFPLPYYRFPMLSVLSKKFDS